MRAHHDQIDPLIRRQPGDRRRRITGDQPPFTGDLGIRGRDLIEHFPQVVRHGIRHPVVHLASPVGCRRLLDMHDQ